jgi:peptide/nickel transport system permease protein
MRAGRSGDRALTLLWQLLSFLGSLVLTFIGLTAITFIIGRFMAVDPVLAVVGDHATQEVYNTTHVAMGLDHPVIIQYFAYLKKLVTGDFGNSIMTSQPILHDLLRFFPATFELATIATVLGVLVGVPVGVVAGARKDGWIDQVVRVIGLFGYSMPVFWLGLVGLFLFYGKLGWVSGPGRLDIGYDDIVTSHTGIVLVDSLIEGEWDIFRNALSHIVLPAGILGYYSIAYIARMTRSFVIEQLSQEYVTAARIKGRSFWGAVWHHAFPNVMVPLITVVGLSYASLLEGAVLTETVFSWPGLGLYITKSLFNADMNAVLGGTIMVGAVFIGVNMLCDFLYHVFDPRLRNA